MKKRVFIIMVGLMMGLSVTGCGGSDKKDAESSLESSLESTEETKVELPTPDPETKWAEPPKPREDWGTEKSETSEFIPLTDREDERPQQTDDNWVGTPKSPEMLATAEDEIWWLNDDNSTEYIQKAEGDEYIGFPDELPVVPYKAKLDSVIGDDLETGYGLEWNWENGESEYYKKWIDCGSYFKIKDVNIVIYFDSENGGIDTETVAYFDELYIMKEGTYSYDAYEYADLEMWLEKNYYFTPRFGLTFDEKGYVIGFFDLNVC